MPATIDVKDAANATVTVATNDALATLIGEVQASPTSNTILDRLKTLATNTAAATPAGTNSIGGVTVTGSATGGATPYHLLSANTTNATVVKASAGTLKGVQVFNLNAAARYLKLYNLATTPDESSTVVKQILIPGNTAGTGAVINLPPEGVAFGTGIAFRTTTGIAANDTGAVAANEILIELDYK